MVEIIKEKSKCVGIKNRSEMVAGGLGDMMFNYKGRAENLREFGTVLYLSCTGGYMCLNLIELDNKKVSFPVYRLKRNCMDSK